MADGLDIQTNPSFGAQEHALTVGRLMKRLELAIADGNHRHAAVLARDLALMKANCVASKINQPFSIRVYVEDKFMQQGPFLIQVSSMMSIRDLKAKIERDWGIPSTFQKWILGRKMAEDDSHSLATFEVSHDSMAFLFLVAPETCGSARAPGNNVQCGISKVDNTAKSASSQLTAQPTYNNLARAGRSTADPKQLATIESPAAPNRIQSKSNQIVSIEKERNPPPLPPKSPVPGSSSTKPPSSIHPPSLQKAVNLRSQTKTGGKNTSLQTAITSDGSSPATALTQSLQQKLSEFKAVAEQTFGKINSSSIPSKQESKLLGKENSPRLSGNRSHESSPRRKLDGPVPDPKPIARKSFKNQTPVVSQGPSKEKPRISSNHRSPEVEPVPENRFNGILLETPNENEKIIRPVRLDRKSSEEPQKKETPSQTESVFIRKENESVKTAAKKSPAPAAEIATTPESVQSHASMIKSENVSTNSEATQNVLENGYTLPAVKIVDSCAPQPKPRGIKKLANVEKLEKVNETVTSSPSVLILPTPLPRTVFTNPPTLPQDKCSNVDTENGKSQNGTVVDDFCQTTLPFPAPKSTKAPSCIASLNTDMLSSKGQTANASILSHGISVNEDGSRHFIRPSAFVSQLKSTGTGVLTSLTGPGIASSSTTASSPDHPLATTAVAHFQSLQGSSTNLMESSPNDPFNKECGPQTDAQIDDKDNSAQSYLKMLELMEKQDLISTSEDSECPVCFTLLPKGEGVVLRDCLHAFCRECLVGCVMYADDSTVKCPYRDAHYACNNNLQEREIKALVPVDVFEKYLARSVKLAESKIINTYHCKTPDCTGWCVFEDDVNVFLCPVCKSRNCLTCAAIHEGMDCQKYQRELAIAAETDEDAKQSRLMLENMIQRGEALDCPACHVVLLKKWGCDWVRCSYCKTEICWVTKGFRWGPGGKGDVSGGCKCGLNGVKCHPKCTYCH